MNKEKIIAELSYLGIKASQQQLKADLQALLDQRREVAAYVRSVARMVGPDEEQGLSTLCDRLETDQYGLLDLAQSGASILPTVSERKIETAPDQPVVWQALSILNQLGFSWQFGQSDVEWQPFESPSCRRAIGYLARAAGVGHTGWPAVSLNAIESRCRKAAKDMDMEYDGVFHSTVAKLCQVCSDAGWLCVPHLSGNKMFYLFPPYLKNLVGDDLTVADLTYLQLLQTGVLKVLSSKYEVIDLSQCREVTLEDLLAVIEEHALLLQPKAGQALVQHMSDLRLFASRIEQELLADIDKGLEGYEAQLPVDTVLVLRVIAGLYDGCNLVSEPCEVSQGRAYSLHTGCIAAAKGLWFGDGLTADICKLLGIKVRRGQFWPHNVKMEGRGRPLGISLTVCTSYSMYGDRVKLNGQVLRQLGPLAKRVMYESGWQARIEKLAQATKQLPELSKHSWSEQAEVLSELWQTMDVHEDSTGYKAMLQPGLLDTGFGGLGQLSLANTLYQARRHHDVPGCMAYAVPNPALIGWRDGHTTVRLPWRLKSTGDEASKRILLFRYPLLNPGALMPAKANGWTAKNAIEVSPLPWLMNAKGDFDGDIALAPAIDVLAAVSKKEGASTMERALAAVGLSENEDEHRIARLTDEEWHQIGQRCTQQFSHWRRSIEAIKKSKRKELAQPEAVADMVQTVCCGKGIGHADALFSRIENVCQHIGVDTAYADIEGRPMGWYTGLVEQLIDQKKHRIESDMDYEQVASTIQAWLFKQDPDACVDDPENVLRSYLDNGKAHRRLMDEILKVMREIVDTNLHPADYRYELTAEVVENAPGYKWEVGVKATYDPSMRKFVSRDMGQSESSLRDFASKQAYLIWIRQYADFIHDMYSSTSNSSWAAKSMLLEDVRLDPKWDVHEVYNACCRALAGIPNWLNDPDVQAFEEVWAGIFRRHDGQYAVAADDREEMKRKLFSMQRPLWQWLALIVRSMTPGRGFKQLRMGRYVNSLERLTQGTPAIAWMVVGHLLADNRYIPSNAMLKKMTPESGWTKPTEQWNE